MNATIWVSLSTVTFLAIVILKSYKLISNYFYDKQKEIKNKILEADEIYQKAHSLYEEYRERMENLELEAEKILQYAHEESQNIINSTEKFIEKISAKKQQELTQRISEYELRLKDTIIREYTDIIIDDLYRVVNENKFVHSN